MDRIPRCGDCRFWGTEETFIQTSGSDYRPCDAVTHAHNGYGQLRDETALAVACDGSDFTAALVCREDFGCVLFQAAEKTEASPMTYEASFRLGDISDDNAEISRESPKYRSFPIDPTVTPAP